MERATSSASSSSASSSSLPAPVPVLGIEQPAFLLVTARGKTYRVATINEVVSRFTVPMNNIDVDFDDDVDFEDDGDEGDDEFEIGPFCVFVDEAALEPHSSDEDDGKNLCANFLAKFQIDFAEGRPTEALIASNLRQPLSPRQLAKLERLMDRVKRAARANKLRDVRARNAALSAIQKESDEESDRWSDDEGDSGDDPMLI